MYRAHNHGHKQTQERKSLSRRRFFAWLGVSLGALAVGPVWGRAQPRPVKIGVLAPLIFNFAIGVGLNRGAQIAREEINANGGILGRPLELIVRDSQLDPRIASRRFEELVAQEGALAVVGGFLDETTIPIVNNVMPRLRTVFLNTGTATPETTELVKRDYENFKFYFRLMLSTDVLTRDTVSAAKGLLADQLGLSKAAVVAEDGSFGRDFQMFLEQELPGVGLEVPEGASFRFPQIGAFDFTNILAQSKQEGAEAFIVAFIRRNGFAFVRQWFDQGPQLPVIGINVSGQAFEYWAQTEGKVISHVYADAATGATAVTEKTLPFFNVYVERYQGQSPPTQPLYTSYSTYDALYVLRQAIERLGEPPPDPQDTAAYAHYKEALVEALEQTDWVGTVGRVRFQGPADPRPHDPFTTDPETGEVLVVPKWVQWQSDTGEIEGTPDRKVVWPPQYKNSPFVPPPEM